MRPSDSGLGGREQTEMTLVAVQQSLHGRQAGVGILHQGAVGGQSDNQFTNLHGYFVALAFRGLLTAGRRIGEILGDRLAGRTAIPGPRQRIPLDFPGGAGRRRIVERVAQNRQAERVRQPCPVAR